MSNQANEEMFGSGETAEQHVGLAKPIACFGISHSARQKKGKSLMCDDYIVYCLYTEVWGVFYVGCGRRARLKYTVKECEGTSRSTCMKCRYIRACEARGITIHLWVVSNCSEKQRAEEMEYALIQMYPSALTNCVLNWHPMKQLPHFLQEVSEQSGAKKRAEVLHLYDPGSDRASGDAEYAPLSVSPEQITQAVDAILTHNDAVSSPELRWYVSVPVVCDLLGGQPSPEKSYLVRKYLASRREELEAHHRQHGLKPSHSRKLRRISEWVKIEREAPGEFPVEELYENGQRPLT